MTRSFSSLLMAFPALASAGILLARHLSMSCISVARFSALGHSASVRTTANAAALMSRLSTACVLLAAAHTSHMLLHAEGASPKCLKARVAVFQALIRGACVFTSSCSASWRTLHERHGENMAFLSAKPIVAPRHPPAADNEQCRADLLNKRHCSR